MKDTKEKKVLFTLIDTHTNTYNNGDSKVVRPDKSDYVVLEKNSAFSSSPWIIPPLTLSSLRAAAAKVGPSETAHRARHLDHVRINFVSVIGNAEPSIVRQAQLEKLLETGFVIRVVKRVYLELHFRLSTLGTNEMNLLH
jgi:hypothetical protein